MKQTLLTENINLSEEIAQYSSPKFDTEFTILCNENNYYGIGGPVPFGYSVLFESASEIKDYLRENELILSGKKSNDLIESKDIYEYMKATKGDESDAAETNALNGEYSGPVEYKGYTIRSKNHGETYQVFKGKHLVKGHISTFIRAKEYILKLDESLLEWHPINKHYNWNQHIYNNAGYNLEKPINKHGLTKYAQMLLYIYENQPISKKDVLKHFGLIKDQGEGRGQNSDTFAAFNSAKLTQYSPKTRKLTTGPNFYDYVLDTGLDRYIPGFNTQVPIDLDTEIIDEGVKITKFKATEYFPGLKNCTYVDSDDLSQDLIGGDLLDPFFYWATPVKDIQYLIFPPRSDDEGYEINIYKNVNGKDTIILNTICMNEHNIDSIVYKFITTNFSEYFKDVIVDGVPVQLGDNIKFLEED